MRDAGTLLRRLTRPPHTSRNQSTRGGGLHDSQDGESGSPRRWSPHRCRRAPAHAQTPPVIDTTGGKTQPGVRLRRRDPRAGLHRLPLRHRQGRRQRHHRDRHHAPEGHQRGPEGAGGDGPEPVLLDARPRQRVRAQARLRRRRPARPVAAVLRQLLRPARLRRDPDGHGRHQQLDRLPERPRRLGQPEREGRDRLAQRPGARRRQERHRRHGALAQRQDGPDRQVLRRHAGQRRRGVAASRA